MPLLPPLEHYEDDRGFLTFLSARLLDFEYPYLTAGTIAAHASRGNHHHHRTFERFICLAGVLRVEIGEEDLVMFPGDVVAITTGLNHVFTNIGASVAFFLEPKSEEFDPADPDTFKEGTSACTGHGGVP